MPAVNFKPQFALAVVEHRKRTTIRKGARFEVGDKFYGYYGMRTKRCSLLVQGVVIHADPITVLADSVIFMRQSLKPGSPTLDALVKADGFQSHQEFFAFFSTNHKLPMRGQLIEWEPLRLGPGMMLQYRTALNRALAGGGFLV